jgi:hypothetical protein
MKSFWYISSLFFILSSCNSSICNKTQGYVNQKPVTGLFDGTDVRKFKAKINYKTTEISGILICKKLNDSIIAGSLINEFGIKGFDFTVFKSNARLNNVFKNLDKWYIRNVLERDLHFMFSDPNPENSCMMNDTLVYVANIKRSLKYLYYFTEKNKLNRSDMYKGKDKIASMKLSGSDQDGIQLKSWHTDGSLKYEFNEMKNTTP